MSYSKYKDLPPKETIEKARHILSLLGVNCEETTYQPFGHLYYTRLQLSVLGWGTNGKGTTEDYSRASAYGEMMERLQNLHLPDYLMELIDEESVKHNNFKYYPDETRIKIEHILSEIPEIKKDMCQTYLEAEGVIPTDEDLKHSWEKWNGEDIFTGLPFYSVKRDSEISLPYEIVRRLCRSNGIASGNTFEEALCQALCEIIERHVLERLFVDGLTPPEIPLSYIRYNCPELLTTIKEVEAMGKYRLLIWDGSLGKGFPVVGLFLIDHKQQRYRIKLGCHPIFPVALERCLTELAQGTDFSDNSDDKQMTPLDINGYNNWDTLKNWSAMFRSNQGYVPLSMFFSRPSWNFQKWNPLPNYNNKQGVSLLINLCLSISTDVLIRDNSFLGFPCVRVYVPGITPVYKFNPLGKTSLISKHLLNIVRDFPLHSKLLSTEDKKALIKLFKDDYHFIYAERLGVSTSVLLGALYYDLGDTSASVEYLSQEIKPSPFIKGAICELKMQTYNINENDRNRVISIFFGQKITTYVALNWRGRNATAGLFDPFRMKKVNESESIKSDVVLKENLIKLYLKMKDMMVIYKASQKKIYIRSEY